MTLPEVSDAILDEVQDHCRSTLATEVGGVFVGTIDGTTATISAALPALKATMGTANVTFTHDVWEDVLRQVDEQFAGQRIVGWYHSHPDFGVFMSEYDQFAHRNFFPDPAMVALVADPVRGEAGWFAGDDVRQIGTFSFEPSAAPARVAVRAAEHRSRTTTTILAVGVVAVLAFAAGWLVHKSPDRSASGASTADLQGQLGRDAAQQDADEAVAQRTAPLTLRVDVNGERRTEYIASGGDTLYSIANKFFGRASRFVDLLQMNPGMPIDPDAPLSAGTRVVIGIEPLPTTTVTTSKHRGPTSTVAPKHRGTTSSTSTTIFHGVGPT